MPVLRIGSQETDAAALVLPTRLLLRNQLPNTSSGSSTAAADAMACYSYHDKSDDSGADR